MLRRFTFKCKTEEKKCYLSRLSTQALQNYPSGHQVWSPEELLDGQCGLLLAGQWLKIDL